MLELKLVQDFRRSTFDGIAAVEIDLEGRVWVLDRGLRTLSSIRILSGNEMYGVGIDLENPHAFAIAGDYALILNQGDNRANLHDIRKRYEWELTTKIGDEPHHFDGLTSVDERFFLYNKNELLIEELHFMDNSLSHEFDLLSRLHSIDYVGESLGGKPKISFIRSNKSGAIYFGASLGLRFRTYCSKIKEDGTISIPKRAENFENGYSMHNFAACGNFIIYSWYDGQKIWWRVKNSDDLKLRIPGPMLRRSDNILDHLPRPTQNSVVAVNYVHGRMFVGIGRERSLKVYEVLPKSLQDYGLNPVPKAKS